MKFPFKSDLLNHSAIYFGASLVEKALPFLLLPFLTHLLSTEEYGTLALYQTFVYFAIPFVGMTAPMMILRDFFKVEREVISELMSSIVLMLVINLMVIMATLAFCFLFTDSITDIPAKWFMTVPLVAFLMVVYQCHLTILRSEKRPFLFGGFEIASASTGVGLTVYFIWALGWSWEGRAASMLLAAAVFSLAGLVFMYRTGYLKLHASFVILKDVYRTAAPLILYSLGGMIIYLSDRLFLNYMTGKSQVGIYSVGYVFGMIVLLFKDAFHKSWSPWLHEQLAALTPDRKIRIVRFSYAFFAVMVLVALGVFGLSSWLIQWMTDESFHGAARFVFWLALANGLNGMYATLVPYAVNENKTHVLAVIMMTAAVINLIANYFLIKAFGAIGAAQATCLAFVFCFIANWIYANKICPMPWFSKDVLLFKKK